MAIDYGTIVGGIVRTDLSNSAGMVIDMEPHTAVMSPNEAPFLTLVSKIGKKVECTQMKHEYMERRLIPAFSTITANVAVGASTLTIADYTRIKEDMYLYVPQTGESFLVTTTPTTTAVAIVRSTTGNGTVQNAITAPAQVNILPDVHAEGEEVPAALTVTSINKSNYLMQMDRRVQRSDISEAVEYYDPQEAGDLDRKQAYIEWKRGANIMMYVGNGSREVISASGARRHVCSGLIERCTENNLDLGGAALTIETVGLLLNQTTTHGQVSDKKLFIVGANGAQAVSAWALNSLRTTSMSNTWGLKINNIITAFGEVEVMYDKTLTANYGLNDRAFLLDMGQIRQMYLRRNDVRLYLAIPNLSGIHTTVDAISGVIGLQLKFEELHSAITGIK